MIIRWSTKATNDLVRLHRFLASVAPDAAAEVAQTLAHAPDRLRVFPRIGEKLDAYGPREVRRIMVGRYEMRYEIVDGVIYVLRLWHSREHRRLDSSD